MTFTIRRFFRSPQFMGALALILSLGFFSSLYLRQQIQTARAASVQVGERWLPELGRANELQATVLKFRNLQFDLVVAQGEAKRQLEKLLDEESAGITIRKKMLESKTAKPEEKRLYDAVSKQWGEYAKIHDRFTMAVKAGNREVASAILTQDARPVFHELENAISAFGAETYSGTTSAQRASETKSTRVQRFAEFLMGANFLLSLLFAFIAYRRQRIQSSRPTGIGSKNDGDASGGSDGGDKVVPFKKAA